MLFSSTCHTIYSSPCLVSYVVFCLPCAGVFLPELCKAKQTNRRQSMNQILSSGAAAAAAAASGSVYAPADAPAYAPVAA